MAKSVGPLRMRETPRKNSVAASSLTASHSPETHDEREHVLTRVRRGVSLLAVLHVFSRRLRAKSVATPRIDPGSKHMVALLGSGMYWTTCLHGRV